MAKITIDLNYQLYRKLISLAKKYHITIGQAALLLIAKNEVHHKHKPKRKNR